MYQLVPVRPKKRTVPSLVAVGIVLLLGLVALHGGAEPPAVWSGRTVAVAATTDPAGRARLRAVLDSPAGRDRVAAVLGGGAPTTEAPDGHGGRRWRLVVLAAAVAAIGTGSACRAALAAAATAACPAVVAAVDAVRDRYPGAARIWFELAESGQVRAGAG